MRFRAHHVASLQGWKGQAELYRLDAGGPLPEHVVVSAVEALLTGPETYVFKSDADGNVEEWGELEGSQKGDLDIPAALTRAGYEVAP